MWETILAGHHTGQPFAKDSTGFVEASAAISCPCACLATSLWGNNSSSSSPANNKHKESVHAAHSLDYVESKCLIINSVQTHTLAIYAQAPSQSLDFSLCQGITVPTTP